MIPSPPVASIPSSRLVDFLVVGGGIIGLNLALEAKRRYPDASVVLLEKEARLGCHASGRNSGVLHAGFYYGADSLKARFCRDGNRELTRYCEERGLPLSRCGKIVVARNGNELDRLSELRRRGCDSGVELVEITAAEMRELEPRARTYGRALYSPSTAAVDPAAVMASLGADARDLGIEVHTGTAFLRWDGRTIHTTSGRFETGYVLNAAGLYADQVAREFGFAQRHRILPFKGLYLQTTEDEGFRTHVYPVPDLDYPFLGVHVTRTTGSTVKIGPTAMPAFWREQYDGLDRFDLREFSEILLRQARLFFRNDFRFRGLARTELRKRSRRRLLDLTSELANGLGPPNRWTWGQPGIRAQLVNVQTSKLEMDFHLEGDDRSFHVLNAVSPAFTSCFPFCRYVLDQVEELIGS